MDNFEITSTYMMIITSLNMMDKGIKEESYRLMPKFFWA